MKIKAEHITKEFSGTRALDDVNIEIPEGKIFGILGPNGAGKTTFIRILNQMIAPTSGCVYIDGRKLQFSDTERIGYLPEERGLYKKMSVTEQILYFASLKGMPMKDARIELNDWFDRLEIGSWRKKKVEELSKGMQQKVQFIATVLHHPSLLILDEPFSGFDPVNADIIKKEIIRLKDQGTTVLLSTHNMNSVEELCDSLSLIHKSKQILSGTVSDVRSSFARNVYEVVFSGYYNKLLTTLTPSIKIIDQQGVGDTTIVIIEITEQVPTNSVLQYLMNSGSVISFKPVLPSMNEIFIEAVRCHNQQMQDGENN